MLESIPRRHLDTFIKNVQVPPEQRPIYLSASAAAILALLAQFTLAPVPVGAGAPPAQSDVEQPDVNWEGGCRPDLPGEIEPLTNNEPPSNWKGGSRPDLPIRNPIPAPVPAPNAEVERLKKTVVNSEVLNMSFLDGVQRLKQEIGIPIEVEAPGGMNVYWPLNDSSSGNELRTVLDRMCSQADSDGYGYRIVFSRESIVIRFEKKQGKPPADRQFLGGIRPDHPGTEEE